MNVLSRLLPLSCVLTICLVLQGWAHAESITLGEATEQPGLMWATGGSREFHGGADSGAKGGDAAVVALADGEEAWIEADLPGPGILDFWFRVPPAYVQKPVSFLWSMWKVEIDGKVARLNGSIWPALIVRGEGPHKVRWTCTAPEGIPAGEVAVMGGLDDVSWIPLTSGTLAAGTGAPELSWRMGGDTPWLTAQAYGLNGLDAVVVPFNHTGNSWIETTVTGPGTLHWSGKIESNWIATQPKLSVNGREGFPLWSMTSGGARKGWQEYHVSVPSGTHVVRWNAGTSVYEDPWTEGTPFDFCPSLALTGVRFEPGTSAIASTLGASDLVLFEGPNRGSAVGEDGGWALSPRHLFYVQAPESGWLNVRWKLLEGDRRDVWWNTSSDIYFNPYSPPDIWQDSRLFVSKDQWLYLEALGSQYEGEVASAPVLQSIGFEAITPVEVAEALELEGLDSVSGWHGCQHATEAHDGVDAVCSVAYQKFGRNVLPKTVQGPVAVTYWWKQQGAGDVALHLDGQAVPMKAATNEWSKAEIRVPGGIHRLEWVHVRNRETPDLEVMASPPIAWVDEVSISPTTPMPFAEAVSAPGRAFAFTGEGSSPWQSVSYTGSAGQLEIAAFATVRSENAPPQVVSTPVTGPAVLSYQAMVAWSDGTYEEPTGAFAPQSVVIESPGGFGNPSQGSMGCYLDGQYRAAVDEGGEPGWKRVEFFVPEGEHLIEWKISPSSGSTVPAGVQAWLREIRVQSQQEHYQEWASSRGISETARGTDVDVDNDGVVNGLEYALGTDPMNGVGYISPIRAWVGSNIIDRYTMERSPLELRVKLPRIQPYARAVVESSEDLSEWSSTDWTLLQYPAGYSRSTFPSWMLDLQFNYTVPLDQGKSFYRLRVVMPGD